MVLPSSALASLPDSLKEKLVPDAQCRGKLQGLHSSVQEISADDALQMFHESICQSNRPSEGSGSHVTSTSDGATESNRMKSLSKDLVLLLHECSDIKVSEEVAWDSWTSWLGISTTTVYELSKSGRITLSFQIIEHLPGLYMNVIRGFCFQRIWYSKGSNFRDLECNCKTCCSIFWSYCPFVNCNYYSYKENLDTSLRLKAFW